MARRASTDLSFVVGVDKPAGMTSHDVVDRCRRIFHERRIGHTGTLDPDATGALVVCVGPATRLDRFLAGHAKTYEFEIVFGSATDTDDASGTVIQEAVVSEQLCDSDFAQNYLDGLVGPHSQIPPAYSAIRKAGVHAYQAAREGKHVELEPRDVVFDSMELASMSRDEQGNPVWQVRARVSAGTYIRSIARDAGLDLGTCAHVGALRRTSTGLLDVASCVSLQGLERDPYSHRVDPVILLGYRVLFADGARESDVGNGKPFSVGAGDLHVFEHRGALGEECACTSGLRPSCAPLQDGELVSIVCANKLKAVYAYDAHRDVLKSACGFSIGVERGPRI